MRRLGFLFVVLAALAAGPASALAAPPAVWRDVEAAVDKLGSLRPPATDIQEYVQPDTQVEPSIAVNPNNPLNIVAGYQEGRIASGGDATNGYATSFDGGKTWTYGELPKLTDYPGQGGDIERASDAVIAFGPDNVVYANSLIFDSSEENGLRSAMTVNVSKDGGKTWSDPVTFQDDNLGGLNDKNWIVVDNSDAPGHKKGRVYVVWDRVAPVVYDYCDANCDDKANWLPNLQTVSGLVFPGQGIGAYPMVMPNGGLGIVIQTTNAGLPTSLQTDNPEVAGNEQVFISAPAAGTTPYPGPLVFIPPIQISKNGSNGVRAQRASDGLPAAAADLTNADNSTGTIYAVWDDGRFRTDKVNDIVIAKTTDNGQTWGAPTRVNPGPPDDLVDHYNAMVAVGSDGAVHVAYRQRVEKGEVKDFSPEIDTYYQESRDGGKTWSAPLKVNSQPSLANYDAFSRNGSFEGDYSQIASGAGNTYVVRMQGEKSFPGEPPALTPGGGGVELTDAGKGHQHARAWVALIKDQKPPAGAAKEGGGTVTTPVLKLQLSVAAKRIRIKTLLKKGLRVRVTSNAAVTGKVRLVLRRGKKSVTVAAKRLSFTTPGFATLKFKASKKGRKALRKAGRKPKLTLVLTAKDSSGAAGTASAKLRVRR